MQSSLKFQNQKTPYVGIFGAGLSGQGAMKLCQALHWPYEVIDEKMHKEPNFDIYTLCVFSPGFPPNHRWWQVAQASSALCINELDFSASCFKNPIIAVTGTNGKTSMVNLITALLQANQQSALAVGNNGTVLSKIVAEQTFHPYCIFVCEVSSYQAWSLKFLRPKYTLWTNIAPDHLTYHGNFNTYVQAKAHLLELTTGKIICGPSLKQKLNFPSNVIFSPSSEKSENKEYPAGFSFGQRENFELLRTFAEKVHIPQNLVENVLQDFHQPPHRLHCYRKCGSVEFWNDSKATNLHAVHSALESLKHKPNVHWILGGQDKGESLKTFSDTFNQYPNVKVIYTIGIIGHVLAQCSPLFNAIVYDCGTLGEVFRRFSTQNATLVLSPGFTSWDQYSSFEKRGEHFEQLAKEY